MADNVEVDVDVQEGVVLTRPDPRPTNTNNTPRPNNVNMQNNNQFGMVRDRLFHAMLVRCALSYNNNVGRTWRRLIEFFTLLLALVCLSTLLFVHFMFTRSATTCLDHIKETWPREGVLRVEVVRNLAMLEYKEEMIREYKEHRLNYMPTCTFNPANVLRYGPQAIPAEIRASARKLSPSPPIEEDHGLLGYFFKPLPSVIIAYPEAEDEADIEVEPTVPPEDEDLALIEEEFNESIDPDDLPYYEYVAEYSLLYGVLRLTSDYRAKHNIEQMTIRIDADSVCFGDPMSHRVMRSFVGYEDGIMASLRTLAKDEKDIGYLHDLRTNEHFHFVSLMMGKTGYITASFIMIVFTFAISMLLRFSHHQIFLFIVDLLHMFELNQPLVFPAAPLLTVILALVGMEAIMSEVFADTTTAFYVILLVWLADQFDAICCHSPISKRFWLRFFYLYQFFFYAYQYRFGGQYGGIALLTSTTFILHSMLFFFHHYEMPLILYQDRLQRILNDIQHNPPMQGGVVINTPPNGNQFHRGTAERTRDSEEEETQATFPTVSTATVRGTVARTPPRVDEADGSPEVVPYTDALLIASEQVAERIVRETFEELLQ